jgi:YggT family protein
MMGSNYLTNPIEFLVHTLFGLYILALMLRFLLAALHADFYNPVSQFLVKITNPPLLPLRRLLPSVGKLDTSALLLILALQMLSLLLIMVLRGGSVSLAALLILSVAELLGLFLNILLFSILIQVILSWVSPAGYNPAVALLHSLTEPVLRPCRRLIPPMSGMDLSPLVAMIAIQLLKLLLLPPLYALAQ